MKGYNFTKGYQTSPAYAVTFHLSLNDEKDTGMVRSGQEARDVQRKTYTRREGSRRAGKEASMAVVQ